MQLTEQYRPRTWEDVVGQDKTIADIKKATRRGYGGEAYWLSGASGTGKTTIARLIAGEIAGELATQEENGQDIDVDYVRRMRAAWSTTVLPSAGSDKTGRAWIINEAHKGENSPDTAGRRRTSRPWFTTVFHISQTDPIS